MKILIQGAEIFDKGSPFHKKRKNILIVNGKINQVGDRKYNADRVITAQGMKVTTGWFDLGTLIGDPGLEHKEDLDSATRAAMAGGFTGLAMLPNTVPPIQSKNSVAYVLRGNTSRVVEVYPLASVTRDNKGEELTEMIDMRESGAVAFSDGLKPLWHTDIMLKSLQYLQRFDGLLIERPEDIWLNMYGQMHEGSLSTSLGLKGMPGLAEEVIVNRDLHLLAYAGGRLHFSRISTARSLALIRSARKKMKVTCDVTSYQPLLGDEALVDFDTNFKVNPPLRERGDREAIIKALEDGTIDVICSGHAPHEGEAKELEFDMAEFGMTSLQTMAPNLVELSQKVRWETLFEKITDSPRELLGIPVPVIDIGQEANLTLFDPSAKWTLDEQTNESKSLNSPWFGRELTGRPIAVFNNGMHYFAR